MGSTYREIAATLRAGTRPGRARSGYILQELGAGGGSFSSKRQELIKKNGFHLLEKVRLGSGELTGPYFFHRPAESEPLLFFDRQPTGLSNPPPWFHQSSVLKYLEKHPLDFPRGSHTKYSFSSAAL